MLGTVTYHSWDELIAEEYKKPYFKKLMDFIIDDSKQYRIFPERKDLFNAFHTTKLDKVKVCILGQDCYHGYGQAHGYAFSVKQGIKPPPSLKNIFSEISSDIGKTQFNSGCLTGWARQGVLLLNSILTVREGQPASHKDQGWEVFTDEAIRVLNSIDRPIVFMLWGKFAQSKEQYLSNERHLVLTAAHPSPYSAYNGFFGCKHFSKANEFLMKNGIQPIDWKSNDG